MRIRAEHQGEGKLLGYADATFANTNNHKSTTGYVFLGSGGVIMWKSKKQTMMVLSSMEAEYAALSEAGHKMAQKFIRWTWIPSNTSNHK